MPARGGKSGTLGLCLNLLTASRSVCWHEKLYGQLRAIIDKLIDTSFSCRNDRPGLSLEIASVLKFLCHRFLLKL